IAAASSAMDWILQNVAGRVQTTSPRPPPIRPEAGERLPALSGGLSGGRLGNVEESDRVDELAPDAVEVGVVAGREDGDPDEAVLADRDSDPFAVALRVATLDAAGRQLGVCALGGASEELVAVDGSADGREVIGLGDTSDGGVGEIGGTACGGAEREAEHDG